MRLQNSEAIRGPRPIALDIGRSIDSCDFRSKGVQSAPVPLVGFGVCREDMDSGVNAVALYSTNGVCKHPLQEVPVVLGLSALRGAKKGGVEGGLFRSKLGA